MFFFFFDENQTMPVSEFLASNNVSPLLLGAFYSRYQFTNDNKNIYTEVSYKVSDYAKDYKLLIYSKKDLLNKYAIKKDKEYKKDILKKYQK